MPSIAQRTGQWAGQKRFPLDLGLLIPGEVERGAQKWLVVRFALDSCGYVSSRNPSMLGRVYLDRCKMVQVILISYDIIFWYILCLCMMILDVYIYIYLYLQIYIHTCISCAYHIYYIYIYICYVYFFDWYKLEWSDSMLIVWVDHLIHSCFLTCACSIVLMMPSTNTHSRAQGWGGPRLRRPPRLWKSMFTTLCQELRELVDLEEECFSELSEEATAQTPGASTALRAVGWCTADVCCILS